MSKNRQHSNRGSWATPWVTLLKEGQTVQFRPRGNSMQGRIESGQLVTVVPVTPETTLQEGEVVLCKVEGRWWLHLVKAVGSDGRFQIGNNKGHINGWTTRDNVLGLVTKVEA